jgi:alpha-1,2-mannosyltransferase
MATNVNDEASLSSGVSASERESGSVGEIWRRAARWFWLVTLVGLTTTVMFVGMMRITGWPVRDSRWLISYGRMTNYYKMEAGHDSLIPMLQAYRRHSEGASPYSVFFEGKNKFQYPPSALLLVECLPKSVVNEALEKWDGPSQKWDGSALEHLNSWLLRFAVVATIALSVAVAHSALGQPPGPGTVSRRVSLWLTAGVIAAGVTFYPFLVAYEIGQMQLVLDALTAGALLFFLRGNRLLAGICIGLCCLIKPQYSLILIWAVIRGERRMVAGWLGTVVPVVVVSCFRYGLTSYFDYLKVLGILSRQGEAFWFNQSLNGLLHRFVDPAGATFQVAGESPLPPYRWGVYAASTIVALCMLLLAFAARASNLRGNAVRAIDLSAVIVASTIASPVAWNHHYGAFFPVFAAVVPTVLRPPGGSRLLAVLLAAAFLAIGLEFYSADSMFQSRWLGLLLSHMFFGGVLLLVVLVAARRRWAGLASRLEAHGMNGDTRAATP